MPASLRGHRIYKRMTSSTLGDDRRPVQSFRIALEFPVHLSQLNPSTISSSSIRLGDEGPSIPVTRNLC